MDVRCERCSTEYEFDDALVSGRGTTVKCTNCGHKFKIRRRDGDFSEDFWNVQTGDGRTLVFTSLRELQRAIQTRLVDRHDMLSRGGLPPKAIGQIPELSPFFDAPTKSSPPAGGSPSASMRASRPPPPPGAAGPSLSAPPPPPARGRTSTRPDFPPESVSDAPAAMGTIRSDPKATLVGTGSLAGAGRPAAAPPVDLPPVRPPSATLRDDELPISLHDVDLVSDPAPAVAVASDRPPPTDREPEPPPTTERLGHSQPAQVVPKHLTTTQPLAGPVLLPPSAPAPSQSAPVVVLPSGAPPDATTLPFPVSERGGRAQSTSSPAFDASSPLPPAPRIRGLSYEEDDADSRPRSSRLSDGPPSLGRRRPVGGYVVALVVLGGVALIGYVWARDNLSGLLGGKPVASSVPAVDPRVTTLLAAGEKALGDGNLEAAKESLDKASALAEKDPRVLLATAHLAASRADVPWLESRILTASSSSSPPPSSSSPPPAPAASARETDEQRRVRDQLAELSSAATKAADAALATAPEDAGATRAKIDALRIAGERDAARGLLARVSAAAQQSPETAYVLAALDLAEAEPLWPTVIERLRIAAGAESGPGRGRAALVYALARSGDGPAAKAEVDRLAGMPRQHPLLPALRRMAEQAKPPVARADAGVDAGPLVVSSADPRDPKARPGDPRDPHPSGHGALPNDPRVLVAQGETARAKGDYERASTLYNAALEKNPNDTEALSGLAAVAYGRRDLNGARASYKRVLSINPSYVPALVGVGDVDWESGDRGSAMKTYKEIVDRFPEGTYPARVRTRLEGSGPAAPPAPAPSQTPASPTESGGGG